LNFKDLGTLVKAMMETGRMELNTVPEKWDPRTELSNLEDGKTDRMLNGLIRLTLQLKQAKTLLILHRGKIKILKSNRRIMLKVFL
jgi:hypothetical protein